MKTDLVTIGLSFLGGSIFTWLFTGGIRAEIIKLRTEIAAKVAIPPVTK